MAPIKICLFSFEFQPGFGRPTGYVVITPKCPNKYTILFLLFFELTYVFYPKSTPKSIGYTRLIKKLNNLFDPL